MSASGLLAATRLIDTDRTFKKEVIAGGSKTLSGFNLTPKEKKDLIAGLTGKPAKSSSKSKLLPGRKTKGTGGVRFLFG